MNLCGTGVSLVHLRKIHGRDARVTSEYSMIKNFFCLAMIAMVSLAGCDDVKGPRGLDADKVAPGRYPRNVAVDPFLNDALVCGPTIVNEGSKDQPMSVAQPIRNTLVDRSINVQYQFVFFDRTGKELDGSGWKFITLESRVERQLEGAALDTNAVDWRLTVRSAK